MDFGDPAHAMKVGHVLLNLLGFHAAGHFFVSLRLFADVNRAWYFCVS